MFSMIYTDTKDFAMKNASEDEAKAIATRTIAEMEYDMWDSKGSHDEFNQIVQENKTALLNTRNPETLFVPRTPEAKVAKFINVKEKAFMELTMMAAVKIRGVNIKGMFILL